MEVIQLVLQQNILPGVVVEGNRILVEILLNYLITNAIRHNIGHGSISIQLSQNSLGIANTGTAPLKHDQLFKRFGTASSQNPGTGLGLALIKQICSRYNWKTDYAFDNNQHVFSLYF
jgi:signal transduction histidine kinase